jgi:glutamine amidotransferase
VTQAVAIIDSGGANIASLKFALERLGASCELTVDPERIKNAPRVILPGVGAAADAMQRLGEKGLDKLLPQLEQPVLGICLGMQLLMDASEEGAAPCLGIISGVARLLESAPGRPVPHMGWNQLAITRNSRLLDGIADGSYFYFVHSYAIDMLSTTVASSDYGRDFSAIIRDANFMGTQFHPERSGENGARLLANFLSMDAGDF